MFAIAGARRDEIARWRSSRRSSRRSSSSRWTGRPEGARVGVRRSPSRRRAGVITRCGLADRAEVLASSDKTGVEMSCIGEHGHPSRRRMKKMKKKEDAKMRSRLNVSCIHPYSDPSQVICLSTVLKGVYLFAAGRLAMASANNDAS